MFTRRAVLVRRLVPLVVAAGSSRCCGSAARGARSRGRGATGVALVGVLIVASPFVLFGSVIATFGGKWDFQNYRYIAPAFPLLAIVAASAFVQPAVPAVRCAIVQGTRVSCAARARS